MESKRKAELEAKRQKLAELRKAREDRRATFVAEQRGLGAETPSESRPSSRAQLDELVSSLLSSGPPSASASVVHDGEISSPALGALNTSGRSSRLSNVNPAGLHETDRFASTSSEADGSEKDITLVLSDVSDRSRLKSPPLPKAEVSEPVARIIEVAPKPKVTYDKAIQTTVYSKGSPPSGDGGPGPSGGVGSSTIDEAELRARLIKEIEAEKTELDRQIAEEKRQDQEEMEKQRQRGLAPEALMTIYASSEFSTFLETSSKVVQRALSDGYDYLRDYSISGGDSTADDNEGRRVKLHCTFSDDRVTRNRSVTSMDWSSRFPELLVAAYNKNPLAVQEPDGIVCVWNQHLLEHPEFTFHAQSDVLSVSFSPFHPNMVIGGTYSGQILLWDTRSRHLPVLKSPLSAAGHTHPVYSLSMVGTQNAHNLVSASTDGTVCAWTLDMLARPQESLELAHSAHTKTDEVSITCLAFPDNEAATFWVGTEEGNVFVANRYDRAGVKAGLVQNEVYRGHSGPVTGLHFHPLLGPVDFTDLFLTCGVDWTIKLWRAKGGIGTGGAKSGTHSTAPSAMAPPAVPILPVYTFEEADDYVFDVKWHPTHPAMFGSVDGSGKFDIWNLNMDTEVPIVSTMVTPNAPRGLNRLAWDRRDGRRAAVGSSDGKVYVYDLGTLTGHNENEYEAFRKTFSNFISQSGSALAR